jgi:hypothetical protein
VQFSLLSAGFSAVQIPMKAGETSFESGFVPHSRAATSIHYDLQLRGGSIARVAAAVLNGSPSISGIRGVSSAPVTMLLRTRPVEAIAFRESKTPML